MSIMQFLGCFLRQWGFVKLKSGTAVHVTSRLYYCEPWLRSDSLQNSLISIDTFDFTKVGLAMCSAHFLLLWLFGVYFFWSIDIHIFLLSFSVSSNWNILANPGVFNTLHLSEIANFHQAESKYCPAGTWKITPSHFLRKLIKFHHPPSIIHDFGGSTFVSFQGKWSFW